MNRPGTTSFGSSPNNDACRPRDYYCRLIEANPIGEVGVELLGDRVTRETATEISADCPKHSSQSKQSLKISKDQGVFFCFGCGLGGSVLHLVEFVESGEVTNGQSGPMSETHRAARDWLAKRAGLPPLSECDLSPEEIDQLERERKEHEEVFRCLTAIAKLCHETLLENENVVSWIRKKWGISRETIKRLKIGWAGDPSIHKRLLELGFTHETLVATGAFVPNRGALFPFFQKRILFPYWSHGRVVYMIGRRTPWTDSSDYEKPKYKKLPVYDAERRQHVSRAITNSVLFGEDILFSRPDLVVITEGITDAIAALQAGIPTISPVTVRLKKDSFATVASRLRRLQKVVIIQDNEISGVGHAGALDTALALERDGVKACIAVLPLGERHEAARGKLRGLLGEKKWAQLVSSSPTARRKILKDSVPENAVSEIDDLLERAKIDLCEFLRDNRTGIDEVLANARSPLEFLIEQVPIRENQIEQIEEVGDLLVEIGQRSPAESDHYIRLLSKKIEVPLSVLRPEAKQRTNKAACKEKRVRAREQSRYQSMPYFERDGRIFWRRDLQEGWVEVALTNFTARITAAITEDDGVDKELSLEIEAKIGNRLRRFTLPAASFNGLGWVIPELGPEAIVTPGLSVKDHTRAAVQFLSGKIPSRTVFTHTGWIKHPELGWIYLHRSGAIGVGGLIKTVETLVPRDIEAVDLPDPPVGQSATDAVRQSLSILDLAPDRFSYPLLGAVYRAPLGPVDWSVSLVGQTGIGKTELAGLAQASFGAAFRDDLGPKMPASWESTENALESLAFAAKDALITIDDFKPKGSSHDIDRLHAKADRVLRGQANRSGRQRLRPDASLRNTKYPRGVILSTGEDTPRGESLRARMLILNVEEGDIGFDRLTVLQAAARNGVFARAMSAYLSWIASRYDQVHAEVAADRKRLRELATRSGNHRRTPGIVADLAAGLHQFLEFARSVDALTEEEVEDHKQRAWEALGRAADEQMKTVCHENPALRFMDLLRAVLSSGRAHVTTDGGGIPIHEPARWGWRLRDGLVHNDFVPGGLRVGWVDKNEGWVLLDPNVAYSAIQDIARSQGEPLTVSLRTLEKRLDQEGLLVVEDTGGERRLRPRRRIEGSRRRVLQLRIGDLYPPEDPEAESETIPTEETCTSDARSEAYQGTLFEPREGKSIRRVRDRSTRGARMNKRTETGNDMLVRVTDVGFITATENLAATGLLGFVSAIVNDSLRIEGLTLRRTTAGRITISYPSRIDRHGVEHHYMVPLNNEVRHHIEDQILCALGHNEEKRG